MQQIITLGLGHYGLQLQPHLWNQCSHEHSLFPKGTTNQATLQGNPHVIYREIHNKSNSEILFNPRLVLCDLESDLKPQILRVFPHLFPAQVLFQRVGGCSNYCRAKYTIGRNLRDSLQDSIRKQAQSCDYLSCFHLHFAYGGATGGGMAALLSPHLSATYPKKQVHKFTILPSKNIRNGPLQEFNALLGLSDFPEGFNFCFQNQSIYRMYSQAYSMDYFSHSDLNATIAKVVNRITLGLRFGNHSSSISTNLTPFPRMNFITPALSQGCYNCEEHIYQPICKHLQLATSQKNILNSLQLNKGKHLASAFIGKEINQLYLRSTIGKKIQRTQIPKPIFNCKIISAIPEDSFSNLPAKNEILYLTNSTNIRRSLTRLVKRFERLYSRRGFVHWYVGEGLSEEFFSEAHENILSLIQDLCECEQFDDRNL